MNFFLLQYRLCMRVPFMSMYFTLYGACYYNDNIMNVGFFMDEMKSVLSVSLVFKVVIYMLCVCQCGLG